MKRILIVVHAFPPESSAGTEQIALHTARELQARGFTVGLLAAFYQIPKAEDLPLTLSEDNFFPLKKKRRAALWQDWSGAARRHFRQTLQTFQPDTIYFHHTLFLSFDLPLMAHRAGYRTIFMAHDFWLICPRSTLMARDRTISFKIDRRRCAACLALHDHPAAARHPWVKLVARPTLASWLLRRRDRQTAQLFKAVDYFISPSQTVATALINRGLATSKMKLIPYGLPTLRTARRPHQPLRFGFIGTLTPHKGAAWLIESFSSFDRRGTTLTIWGPAEKPEELAALPQPGITYAGSFRAEETQSIYDSLDCLIVPSRWPENQPLVILQAFQAGLPVVTANLGGMAELVQHNRNGLTYQWDSPESLRGQLERLIVEPGLYEKLARGAVETRVPTPSEHVEQLLPLLNG